MIQWIPQNPLGKHAICHVRDSTGGRFRGSQCTDIAYQGRALREPWLQVEGVVEGGRVGWGGEEKEGGHRGERAGASRMGEVEDVHGC